MKRGKMEKEIFVVFVILAVATGTVLGFSLKNAINASVISGNVGDTAEVVLENGEEPEAEQESEQEGLLDYLNWEQESEQEGELNQNLPPEECPGEPNGEQVGQETAGAQGQDAQGTQTEKGKQECLDEQEGQKEKPETIISCYDNDGGVSKNSQGICVDGAGREYVDYCELDILVEYSCEIGKCAANKILCGEGCKNGECLGSVQNRAQTETQTSAQAGEQGTRGTQAQTQTETQVEQQEQARGEENRKPASVYTRTRTLWGVMLNFFGVNINDGEKVNRENNQENEPQLESNDFKKSEIIVISSGVTYQNILDMLKMCSTVLLEGERCDVYCSEQLGKTCISAFSIDFSDKLTVPVDCTSYNEDSEKRIYCVCCSPPTSETYSQDYGEQKQLAIEAITSS